MKIAVIKFPDTTNKFDFFFDDPTLCIGDQVVVDTQRGLSIGEVIMFKDASSRATAWVVQKVDLAAYNKRMEAFRKMKEVQMKLELCRKQLSDMVIYEQLAQSDPMMRQLLDDLKVTQAELNVGPTVELQQLKELNEDA